MKPDICECPLSQECQDKIKELSECINKARKIFNELPAPIQDSIKSRVIPTNVVTNLNDSLSESIELMLKICNYYNIQMEPSI